MTVYRKIYKVKHKADAANSAKKIPDVTIPTGVKYIELEIVGDDIICEFWCSDSSDIPALQQRTDLDIDDIESDANFVSDEETHASSPAKVCCYIKDGKVIEEG